jgi:hypothetical protein
VSLDGALRAAAERHVGDTGVPGLVALVSVGDDVHVESLGSRSIACSPNWRGAVS